MPPRWPVALGFSSAATTTKSPSTASPSNLRTEPDGRVVQPLTRRAFLTFGAVALGTVAGLAGVVGATMTEPPQDRRVQLGDLTLVIRADPWRLSLLGPTGNILW